MGLFRDSCYQSFEKQVRLAVSKLKIRVALHYFVSKNTSGDV